jgi:hypothetical protein
MGCYLAHLIVNGAIMLQDLKYPKWQQPLAAAILEFDANQLPAKIQRAEEAIVSRFQELSFGMRNQEELRLLSDGLAIVRDLKQDRLACVNNQG